jgi:hypothetical protein
MEEIRLQSENGGESSPRVPQSLHELQRQEMIREFEGPALAASKVLSHRGSNRLLCF